MARIWRNCLNLAQPFCKKRDAEGKNHLIFSVKFKQIVEIVHIPCNFAFRWRIFASHYFSAQLPYLIELRIHTSYSHTHSQEIQHPTPPLTQASLSGEGEAEAGGWGARVCPKRWTVWCLRRRIRAVMIRCVSVCVRV